MYMMKRLLFLSVLILTLVAARPAAELFKTSRGSVSFSSEAPMEIIMAKSTKLVGLINTSKNSFAFQVAVISFEGFNSELQREHFNENYMESTKFPKVKFVGKIDRDVDYDKNGTYPVKVQGKLNVHGIIKEREISAAITIIGKMITIKSEFEVSLEDHDIKIPTIVNQKLAKVITCKVQAELAPKN